MDNDVTEHTDGKKNRPTPKRKEQEAQRKRSAVYDPKSTSKDRRAKVRAQRDKEFAAMRSGDERNMPAEHRGPERRYLRDLVDARTTIGEFLLPASILFVIVSLIVPASVGLAAYIILFFYVVVLIAGVETFIIVRRTKARFIEKFGANALPRGFSFYVIARQLNVRRFRTPKPKVKRGEYPV